MIWKSDMQPLPPVSVSQNGTTPDTFVAYLQRHHLAITTAARIAALPSSLVWRATKWLPISERNACVLVTALGRATGETFHGFILTRCNSTPAKVIRFPQ